MDFNLCHILESIVCTQALRAEDFIWLMLLCNVIVKQEANHIDVAYVRFCLWKLWKMKTLE